MSPSVIYGSVAEATFKAIQCAVADLPDDEEYPDHEIRNKKLERIQGACKLGGGMIAVLGGVLMKDKISFGAGAAAFLEGFSQTDEAHKDIVKMEQHNTAVRECREREQERQERERTRRESVRDARYTQ